MAEQEKEKVVELLSTAALTQPFSKRKQPRRKSAQLLFKAEAYLLGKNLPVRFAYFLRDRWKAEHEGRRKVAPAI